MKKLYTIILIGFMFCMSIINVQAQNLLEGWDNTAGTPYDAGWRVDESVSALWGTLNGGDNRYRTNVGFPASNGSDPMIYITLEDTKFGYPVTTTAGKIYELSGKAWRRNGGDGSLTFNFYLADNLLASNPVSSSSITLYGNNVVNTLNGLRFVAPEGFTDGYLLWDVNRSGGYWNDASLWLLNMTELGNALSVTFNVDGGSSVENQYFLEGETYKITVPTEPTRDGYIFDGWYSDEACINVMDFSTAVGVNTTVYAKWNGIKNELNTLISDAKTLLSGGTATGQSYLEAQITIAQEVVDNTAATIEEVTNAFDTLSDAINVYQDVNIYSLQVNDVDLNGFSSTVYDYTYDFATGAIIPDVSAVGSDAATIDITQITEIPGTATVVLTSGDGTTVSYTIAFRYDYMMGWDGNGIGTSTDIPSDFGWACSTPVSWINAADGNDNYAYRFRDNLGVGRVVTHPINNNVFSYPIQLEGGKVYEFTCSNTNMNGTVSTTFGINTSADATGVMLNSQTKLAPRWNATIDYNFIFATPADGGTYYMVWQTSNGSDRNIAWNFKIVETGNALAVTFDTDGGSEVSKQYFANGDTYEVVEPEEPTKEGYTFAGWFTDNSYSELFDFNATVVENTTVYARFVSNDNPDYANITLNNEQLSLPTAKYMNITVNGTSELHLTSEDALLESTINLMSEDAWLYFDSARPSKVASDYASFINVNGNAFNPETDRIAIYGGGTVVIPNGKAIGKQALTVYSSANYSGESMQFEVNKYYRTSELADFNNNVRSFKLKKGYSCTLANNPDGTGFSRVYIASDEDVEVPVMPEGLDFVSFVRVFRWEWVSKKGICGGLGELTNVTWYNDWAAGGYTESPDYEYVPMRHNLGWDSFETINARTNVSHVLGYNEPDHSDQSNCTPEEAIRQWPELFKSGLRLGSPTPDAIRKQWLIDFLAMADSLNYRVDFVVGHMYWNSQTGQSLYNGITDACVNRYGGRPMWITEWNNGANWTTEYWPTASGPLRDADLNIVYDENGNEIIVNRPLSPENSAKQLAWIQDALDGLDRCEYLERHSLYNWVQDARAMVLGGKLTPAGKYFADYKSKVAFSKSKEYIHNWRIAPPLPGYTYSDDFKSFILNWYDHNGETGTNYVLERKLDGETDFTTLATLIPGEDYEYGGDVIYSDLITDKFAEYRIKATSYKGTESIYSRIISLKLDAVVSAPSDLTGTVVSSSILDLSWSLNSDARSYNLKRSSSIDGTYETIGSYLSENTFRDSELTPNTTYYYKISSVNNLGETADSEPIAVTTNAITVPTDIPGVFLSNGDSQVAITWDFQYDVLHRIYRSDSENGDYEIIADNIDATRYADKNLVNGKEYYYKVAAYNSAGEYIDQEVYTVVPTLGQCAYFNFDESNGLIHDLWGGYHGISYETTKSEGITNNAKVFDAARKSYVQVESGITSELNDFTISLWGNFSNKGSRIFDFGNSTGVFMILTPGLRYKITCPSGTYDVTASGHSIPTGEWVNIAISQAGTTFKMYMNGNLIFEDDNAVVKPSDMGENLYNYLIRSRWSSDKYTTCMLDEFRIYNRALNAEEVNALMNESVYSLDLSSNELNLKIGETSQLASDVFPDNAYTGDLVWNTTDENIATVVDGLVTAKGLGSAKVCLETSDGSVVTNCVVNVSTFTGFNKLQSKAYVTLKNSVLTVVSQNQEVIEVYDLTGQLLIKKEKSVGSFDIEVPSRSKLLIVKGSTGWVNKVVELSK
ncbi:InlB B-repeat-containing protein [Plebeiibacterium sediminum]|uniref:InlB B-repeat-containing protein n=1 Tax=Plebeiibacterium sediminum TaxID=2992112 RepID=A0AAE3SDU2_9BACT|nr:InlB B-repeat-containing protein [Plebeiobacterium sediminum]MCW3785252.1 InlB B-repeat-containing protein [Plebeiobacterium sediminum]